MKANRRLFLLLSALPGGIEKIVTRFKQVFTLMGLDILAENEDAKLTHSVFQLDFISLFYFYF
jgi:hypothetical protein